MFSFKIQQGLEKLPQAKEIRKKVFIEEQGFCNEFDDIDKEAYHVVVYYNNEGVATGRTYKKDNETFAIGRVAVLKEYRKKGIGNLVIEKLEEKLLELGIENVYLSAQLSARKFYEKLGYLSFGEEYLDEHCPHIAMKKTLLK